MTEEYDIMTSYGDDVVVAYDWTTKLIDALSFEFDKDCSEEEEGKGGRISKIRLFINVCCSFSF